MYGIAGPADYGSIGKKGRIEYSVWYPIAPKATVCAKRPIMGESVTDFDAPIIYGTNDQTQEAAVYAENTQQSENKNASTGLEIRSSVLDQEGKRRDLTVWVYSTPTKDGVRFTFEFPSGTVLGISRIADAMNKDQFLRASSALKEQSAAIEISGMANFVSQGKSASDDDAVLSWARKQDEQFAFLTNKYGKIGFEISGSTFHAEPAKLVLLDRERKPILVSKVDVLVPNHK